MVNNTRNFWVSGLYPSSGVWRNTFRKQIQFPKRCVPSNTGRWIKSINPEIVTWICTEILAQISNTKFYRTHSELCSRFSQQCVLRLLSNPERRFSLPRLHHVMSQKIKLFLHWIVLDLLHAHRRTDVAVVEAVLSQLVNNFIPWYNKYLGFHWEYIYKNSLPVVL
jgi:hypothetical protein